MPDDHPRNQLPDQVKREVNPTAKRLITLAIVAGIAGLLFWLFRDYLSFQFLASREADLRLWQTDYPFSAALLALALYIAVAGLSLPGAAALTLVLGWYFGFWEGLLLVSFGSTGGATVAFLLSRYLLREWIQSKMQARFARINEAFEREGAFYLFTLRLIPAVPFFAINTLMGLTRIRVSTFWWISQIGMLPGTAAYVYAGSAVPDLQTLADEGPGRILSWRLLLAFALLGILPLVIKRSLALIQAGKKAEG